MYPSAMVFTPVRQSALGEMQSAYPREEIMNRFHRDIEVVDDHVYLRSSFIRGIRELLVVVRREVGFKNARSVFSAVSIA